jgi:regulator of protease activity HflC (stomatin/prohibitin superfamily)
VSRIVEGEGGRRKEARAKGRARRAREEQEAEHQDRAGRDEARGTVRRRIITKLPQAQVEIDVDRYGIWRLYGDCMLRASMTLLAGI